jgi:hypothetical protein
MRKLTTKGCFIGAELALSKRSSQWRGRWLAEADRSRSRVQIGTAGVELESVVEFIGIRTAESVLALCLRQYAEIRQPNTPYVVLKALRLTPLLG